MEIMKEMKMKEKASCDKDDKEDHKKRQHDMIRKINAYALLVIVMLFVITGYGITQYRIVEMITFGLLTKQLSFILHMYLIIPLVFTLLVHLCSSCGILSILRRD